MRARDFLPENRYEDAYRQQWQQFQPDGEEQSAGMILRWQQVRPNRILVQALSGDGSRKLGSVQFHRYDPTNPKWTGEALHVDERYRRQGVATAMYDWFKQKFGPIRPSDAQTRDGESFWQRKKVWEQESGDPLSKIVKDFVSSPVGQKYAKHDCKTVTRAFVQWADQNQIPTQVIVLAPPSAAFIKKNPRFQGKSGEGDGHIMPIVDGQAIDFTVRQFGVNRPFERPLITPVADLPSVYGRFGYFTDRPEWFLGGKSHWIGPLNQIPKAIFNQEFGDEILEQGVREGFSNDMSTEDMIGYLKQHHDKNLHPDYLDHLTSTNSKFVLKNIPINSIKTELSGLDRAKVERYKKMDFSKAPPIVVGSDGYILDGYHRATAAKALGIPTIKAYVGVKSQQGMAEGQFDSLIKSDQAERNAYKKFVADQAGGDWKKGARLYAKLKNRPADDIFGDDARLQQFMRIKFDFANFTKQDWRDFWLLSQHADKYPDFQQQALDAIQKHLGQDNDYYRYLADRISCARTGQQKYGTQDICDQQGVSEQAEDHGPDMAISLRRLGKFHPGQDPLAELVPERASARYALHPDKWQSTFYSLTNKDPDKLRYYGPTKIAIPPGTLVGDMAIANQFYRAKTAEEKQRYAELYRASLQPYPVDVSRYRMPELLMPRQEVSE